MNIFKKALDAVKGIFTKKKKDIFVPPEPPKPPIGGQGGDVVPPKPKSREEKIDRIEELWGQIPDSYTRKFKWKLDDVYEMNAIELEDALNYIEKVAKSAQRATVRDSSYYGKSLTNDQIKNLENFVLGDNK